jgi:hypothetical protein
MALACMKGPLTQKTFKHLKKGGIKKNKGIYEGGRKKCAP